MPHHGENLRRARESAGLDVTALATLLERGEEEVARAEGEPVVDSTLLQDYAEVFGIGVRALLRGEAEDGPAALLFRSMMAADSEFDVLARSQVQRVLGRFMQKVREAADLRAGLGSASSPVSSWPRARALPATAGTAGIVQQAESLSLEVRRWLELGTDEPVDSAIRLVRERLAVEDVGLVGPWLRELAAQARAREVIDEVDLRRILGISLSSEVEGLAPLRPRQRAAADAAVLFVQDRWPEVGAVFAGEVRAAPRGGFAVPILQRTGSGIRTVGVLRLSSELVVENAEEWRQAEGAPE